eukprot:TRINITY_DN506_c0_g1_i2.p5 TRINITY_DN506_c0_g1~~TRINITY_DN506_c0_g1_i2.p5  ORF type:complete len:108 (-),score=40.30 TRINITY_DN506_c0_g1_i2:53-376(-)
MLTLTFEELTREPEATARKLIAFLGWPELDDETLREKVLPKANIAWLRDNQSDYLFHESIFRRNTFVRQGKVGENKTKITAEQIGRLKERAQQELEPDCFAMWFHDS